jgi:ABC-type antimicrobial peptide transport system permease subunit
MSIAKIITMIVGIALGAALLGAIIGLTVSALVIGVLALTMLVRRDWVPVVYNVRSLTQRGTTTGVTAVGLALVVFVFATVLMLADGVKKTLAATGSTENAKVIRKGSQNEIQSGVQPEHLRMLAAAPETAIGRDGQGLASSEVVVLIFAQKADAKTEEEGTNLTVRGLGDKGLELHSPRAIDGRTFKPGTSEIIIGKGLVGRFKGADLGQSMHFARRDWTVVGVMDQGGSAYDSEVWGDVEQFLDAFQRRPAFSSVTLKLKDAGSLAALQTRMAADPQLNTLEAKREIDYWSAQSEQLAMFVRFLGVFVAVIFSFGAILGAMITMYAQVAARTREIGTLRAIGFRRRSVLVSFVLESVLLALASGGLGLAGASAMRLVRFSTINWQTFSEVSFKFTLTPGIIVASIIFAGLMGYAGGLLPAVRASRMPIVQATRGG